MRAAQARLSLILLSPPLLALGCGTQKSNAVPRLTVRTYNHAALPAPTLEHAEQLPDDVFHQAGIELEWVECGVSPEDTKKFAACDKVLERRSPSVVLNSSRNPWRRDFLDRLRSSLLPSHPRFSSSGSVSTTPPT